MKLVIFGAAGRTGFQLVKQALNQRHTVTAFIRNRSRFHLMHANLRIALGNVLNPSDVKASIQGHDAVICTLGMPLQDQSNLRAIGTKNIIYAMKATGIQRFICLSSLGFGDSRAILPFYLKYIIVPLILRHSLADHAIQESLIKESSLHWTVVRPGNLSNGCLTGNYKHGFPATERNIQLKISRADVADFMLKQLKEDTYLHSTPGISY